MSKELYRNILDCLARRQRLVLATVVTRSGSGPREAGASMVVTVGGESMGTVGGGLLEAQVLAAAKNALHSARPVCLTFSLTAKEVAAGGMLCGGRVEVLVDVLEGKDTRTLTIFEKIVTAQEQGRGLWLIRSIGPEESERDASSDSVGPELVLPVVRSSVRTGLGLMDDDKLDAGSLALTNLTMDTLKQERRREETVLIARDVIRYLLQPVVLPGRVIIA
ncbi:MAG TPA: hypothetical protein DCG53_11210, partial [Syntrophus sp. (in: bacteria)]|nr:hypothetical protein [Syntrophus sp. (in: bacteria)]